MWECNLCDLPASSFTIPDSKAIEIINTLADAYNYDSYLQSFSEQEDGSKDQALNKPAFVKQRILNYIKEKYRHHKRQELDRFSRATLEQEEVDITWDKKKKRRILIKKTTKKTCW